MPSRTRIFQLSVAFAIVLIQISLVSGYDLNTCWQQCFNKPPANRAVEAVLAAAADRGRRSSSSSSDSDHENHRRRRHRHSDNTRSSSSDSSSSDSDDVEDNYVNGTRSYSLLNQLGLEARRLRERYASQGVNFLLDVSLSYKHRLSSESAKIFRHQKNLALILAIMLELGVDGIGSGSVTLFDQSAAWSCAEWGCLGACEIGTLLPALTNVETGYESGRRGDIQSACSLSYFNLADNTNRTCANATNPMAIAVVNSELEQPFHIGRNSKHRYEDQSELSCGSYQARYLVGTHSSRGNDHARFSSGSARSRYVPDDWQTMAAVQSLADCMYFSCCDITKVRPPTSFSSCLRADGFLGRDISAY